MDIDDPQARIINHLQGGLLVSRRLVRARPRRSRSASHRHRRRARSSPNSLPHVHKPRRRRDALALEEALFPDQDCQVIGSTFMGCAPPFCARKHGSSASRRISRFATMVTPAICLRRSRAKRRRTHATFSSISVESRAKWSRVSSPGRPTTPPCIRGLEALHVRNSISRAALESAPAGLLRLVLFTNSVLAECSRSSR